MKQRRKWKSKLTSCYLLFTLSTLVLLTACSSTNKKQEANIPEAPVVNYQKAAVLNAKLAIVYTQRGMLDRAKEKLLKAKSQDADIPEIYYAEGLYYQTLGMNDIAEPFFKKALSMAPKDYQAYNFYAQFLCEARQQYRAAEMLYQKSILLPRNVNLAETFTLYGQCLLVQHKEDAAKKMFERAINQGISSSYAYWELAVINEKEGNYTQALSMVNEYITRAGNTKEALTLKMNILQHLGRNNEAATLRLLLNSKDYQNA
ncbi:hypothetical protein [Fangia hongkongensis]|uniref:hypothetical protein n=1 Tax=Fangia hongkongensis TaxID=270495 RepID=UPI00036A9A7D|nr:hypothetical protein [Fangia hongkongensis]MBK2124469.1 hypothetical protein [Fangia hongkongensis]